MKAKYIIEGITCQGCVAKIEKELNNTKGINKASVNITNNKMTLLYDEKSISLNEIADKVKKLGYDVSYTENKYEKITIEIEGMTCQGCVAKIEDILSKTDGLENYSINLRTKALMVDYDKKTISKEEIIKKISDAGYIAKEIKKKNQEKNDETNKLKKEFTLAIIFAAVVFIVSMGSMVGLKMPQIISPEKKPINFALFQFLLTLVVMYAGRSFYTNGFKRLAYLNPNMDSLIAVGTMSAVIYSIIEVARYIIRSGSTMHLYFESAAVIIALLKLGKYLENRAKKKTGDSIRELMSLSSNKAILLTDEGQREVDIDSVKVSDKLLVRSGDKIPVDGIVVEGKSYIDESMLTGESVPVVKEKKDKVYAGTLNGNHKLIIEASEVGEGTVLSQIIKMVEEAQTSKAPIARVADKISLYFVPIVIAIAFVSSIIWLITGSGFNFALSIFISVLVIACPCALGLATPTAIMVGIGKGAKLGILIKSANVLESAKKMDTVVFDKTGTITYGRPKVTGFNIRNNMLKKELYNLVYSVEKLTTHPYAEALLKYAKEKDAKEVTIEKFEEIIGTGVKAEYKGKEVFIGSKKLLDKYKVNSDFEESIFIFYDGILIASVFVEDEIKKESKKTVEILEKMGLRTIMITGDNEKTAMKIAKKAGISKVYSQIMPGEKADIVKSLQEEGRKVIMVGDGINDAPALTNAHVGVSVRKGTDVAIESADVLHMKDSLMDVGVMIDLSKKTFVNIKQNLFWAFFYNVLGIPIAAGVLYIFGGPLLNPMFAALAMAFSSVSVVANALRLKKYKAPYN